MSSEVELKLSVTPEDFAALKAHAEFRNLLAHPVSSGTLDAIYYDTPRCELHGHGISLRVRREHEKYVQTIKSLPQQSPGLIERTEWEQAVPGRQPDLGNVPDAGLAAVFTDRVREAIGPAFETKIHRTVYRVTDALRGIELAFDQGEIIAGERKLPVCEIELELKHGDRAALFALARSIAAAIPAQLTLKSKSERGYELAAAKSPRVVTSFQIDLAPGTTAAHAFQSICRDCLRQLIANVPALCQRNPGALHQARIALRRMRTAISLFSEIVRDHQVAQIKAELKWLGREFAPARDLDALLTEVMRPLRKQHPDNRGLQSLYRSFSRQRLQEYDRASAAVRSPRFRRLLIETLAWVDIGEWVTTTDETARLRRERPIEAHAADQLSRRRKKVRKRGRAIQELDPAHRHRLRIQVKKTRYATEFFAGLFRRKKAARRGAKMLNALKRMQNSLGGLNDVATRRALCAEILSKPGRATKAEAARDLAFAAGLVTGDQEARSMEFLDDAKKAHARIEDIKPFWK
jgi:inorganic triphosphatase YgiF